MDSQVNILPQKQTTCAIIVTYHPDNGFPHRLERIIQQVDRVVIVDNHSSDFCLEMLRRTASRFGSDLIINTDNLGIAAALNQGVEYAKNCGYKWVLTLDQDTLVLPDLVENLILTYNGCPFWEVVGVVGVNVQEKLTGKTTFDLNTVGTRRWLETINVITSGSLLSVKVFEKVGPFREEFFIDLVDFEFCLRLRANGYKSIVSLQIGIIQSYGECKFHKILWLNKTIRDYSPLRCYYRTRNALILVREYFWKESSWAIWRLWSVITRIISILIFEKNKIFKTKYIGLGIYHAIINKSGKLDRA